MHQICYWQKSVFRPFLPIFMPATWPSFTKLKFRRSFWGAEQIYIFVGSKVMTQNANISLSIFFNFVKNLWCFFACFFFAFVSILGGSVNHIPTGEGKLSPPINTGTPNVFHHPASLIIAEPIKIKSCAGPHKMTVWTSVLWKIAKKMA